MTIASALFLFAAGAILRYAVTREEIESIDLATVGLILMIVGAVGFVVGLFQEFSERRRATYVERHEEPPRDPRYR